MTPPTQKMFEETPVQKAKTIIDASVVAELEAKIAKLEKAQVTEKRTALLDRLAPLGLKEKFKNRSLVELQSIIEGVEAMPKVKQFGEGKTSTATPRGQLSIYNWKTGKHEYR